jgi:hypothetical protein
VDVLGWHEVQDPLNGLEVLVVLAERVLKPVRVWADELGPRGRAGVRDNGATVMLGFDHKDAAPGDEDMINLGRAILQGEGEMIQKMIRGARKFFRECSPDSGFTLILQGAPPASAAPEAEPEAESKRDKHGEHPQRDAVDSAHVAPSYAAIF